jgi:endonuclease/exonuclease/phosphatase family metal-dependent hydrolase
MREKPFYRFDSGVWLWVVMVQALMFSLLPTAVTSWKEKGLAATYLAASRLTDPLCKAHQLYHEVLLVDTLYAKDPIYKRCVRKGALLGRAGVYAICSLFTTLPGIELRWLAHHFQEAPFIYFRGKGTEKKLTENSVSLLSWNVCCVSGGYSITDGGVLPWFYRLQALVEAIRGQDTDLVCLYEIFDIQTALRLVESLKDKYAHFYANIGPNVIGLSSGLFVASKVPVGRPEFVAFAKEKFYGRAKHCNKGFFSFDVHKDDQSLMRIFSTHLQHSEMPVAPSFGEIEARRAEMEQIMEKIVEIKDQLCVLTGDFNLEEKEYETWHWKEHFERGTVQGTGCTWGGDQFCSALTGKPISFPLNLDHTLMTKSGRALLHTSYLENGFDGTLFNPAALSDHKGLLSIITFCQF